MLYTPFLSYLESEKRYSAHTVKAYRQDILSFLTFREQTYPGTDTSLAHIRRWISILMGENSSPATINRKISALKSYFKFLQREGQIAENPAQLVSLVKKPKKLPVVVAAEPMDRLLDDEAVFTPDFEGLRDRLVLELLFGTGMRLAELLGLDHDAWNRYERTLRIFGKRKKERIVPVNTTLAGLIDTYLRAKESENFHNNSLTLIVTTEGKPAYEKLIYRIVKKYIASITTNTKKSPHVLRHSFATALLNKGAELNAIKELLGHSSLAATQVYTHNSVERLKSIYKQAHPKA
ncbi:MAG: tyrosine-type recombinase/integrase [Mucilaginibacter polytrichastri]|nr:tyrosine-type recombinase/integrase [Mucilaginibacter polytrichastri]